ncbi:Putative transmembrane protein (PGPGW) [Geodermatophilus saharensis]|uniref:Putative transmembrane protein (PGPGW) n=1 Tax=Geodermatophilus saharensis TaxID=1137994 RepID=A0A239EBA1_9ACTN|nr:PGPGW domain-containing protein [Geodermatophilus saharensis]SNS41192.1 Putative transmembrane protein (PGPGW) [Geodermatophilus saharensis]
MDRTATRSVTFTGNRAGEGRRHDDGPGGATRCPDCTDGLGRPRPVEPGSWRDRVRENPALALPYRIAVFIAGLLFVLLGLALTVLPGPLTIPPVLVGLWVWSTEFEWARRIFATFRRKAVDTWRHARQHPVSSLAVTVGGLAAAALVFWAVGHFHLVDRATSALGLG